MRSKIDYDLLFRIPLGFPDTRSAQDQAVLGSLEANSKHECRSWASCSSLRVNFRRINIVVCRRATPSVPLRQNYVLLQLDLETILMGPKNMLGHGGA